MSLLQIVCLIGFLAFHFATEGAFIREEEASEPGLLGVLFVGGLLFVGALYEEVKRLRRENHYLRTERKP